MEQAFFRQGLPDYLTGRQGWRISSRDSKSIIFYIGHFTGSYGD
jgi:hypothetical protein